MLPESVLVFDPYALAEAEFNRRVEALQAAGAMRRASQIETEEELDEHFDALSRLYRQVCSEMNLAWPPPPSAALNGQDEREFQGEEDEAS